MGTQRKTDEQERLVEASIGRSRLVVFIVVVDAGLLERSMMDIDALRHDRAPSTHANIHCVLQEPGQVFSKSRLLYPIAQIKSVGATNQKSVSRFQGREPVLF